MILAYKLIPDVPPPRHQPAADLLRAVDAPYDGGWFADSLAGGPDEALAVVTRYLKEPGFERCCRSRVAEGVARPYPYALPRSNASGERLTQGSQVVKAAVCKTVYRWFDSIPWDHHADD